MNPKAKNEWIYSLPLSSFSEDNKLFIQQIINQIPKNTLCCLEVHSLPKVDFLFCIDLATQKSINKIPSDNNNKIKDLYLKLSVDAFLKEYIRNIWVTYDYDKNSISQPWAYVLLKRNLFGKEIQKLIINKTIQSLWHTHLFIPSELLNHCIDHLPDKAYIFGLSTDVREDKMSRLIIGNLTPQTIVSYMINLNWIGPLALLKYLCLALDHDLWYSILLDYKEAVMPNIGIEVWFDPIQSKKRASSLIDTLLKNKHLSKELIQTQMIHSLLITDKQWINHIKIQISSSGQVEIKTYLFYVS